MKYKPTRVNKKEVFEAIIQEIRSNKRTSTIKNTGSKIICVNIAGLQESKNEQFIGVQLYYMPTESDKLTLDCLIETEALTRAPS